MDPASLSALTIAGVGLLLLLVPIPLWLEKIPPNRLYGFRTPRTIADARVWYPANRVMGQDMMLAGILMVLCALGMGLVVPPGTPLTVPLIVLSGVVPILAVLHGFYRAAALVAELDGFAPPTSISTATATPQANPEPGEHQRAREAAHKQRES